MPGIRDEQTPRSMSEVIALKEVCSEMIPRKEGHKQMVTMLWNAPASSTVKLNLSPLIASTLIYPMELYLCYGRCQELRRSCSMARGGKTSWEGGFDTYFFTLGV